MSLLSIVATPIGIRPIRNYDADKLFLGNFIFDWGKIKSNCKKFFIYHSDDDPFVLLKENKVEFETRLNAKTIVEFKKGHFSGSDGITELPRLLEELGKMSNGNN